MRRSRNAGYKGGCYFPPKRHSPLTFMQSSLSPIALLTATLAMFMSARSTLLLAAIQLAVVNFGFVGAIPHDTSSAVAAGPTMANDPSGCCSPCVAACGEAAEAATGCNQYVF